MVQKVCTIAQGGNIPASDDFSGTGDNSGSVGDINWDCRWEEGTPLGDATISINSSNKLQWDLLPVTNETSRGQVNNNAPDISGDFKIVINNPQFDSYPSNSSIDVWAIDLLLTIGGVDYSCGFARVLTDYGHRVFRRGSSPITEYINSFTPASSYTIERNGNILSFK